MCQPRCCAHVMRPYNAPNPVEAAKVSGLDRSRLFGCLIRSRGMPVCQCVPHAVNFSIAQAVLELTAVCCKPFS